MVFKKKALLFFCVVCLYYCADAQQPDIWRTYYGKNELYYFADDGNYLWSVQADKLIQFDKTSGDFIYIDLPDSLYRCYSTHTNMNDYVMGIIKANDGALLVYTNRALGRYQNGAWSISTPIEFNYYYSLVDSVGGIWSGGESLLRYIDPDGNETIWDTLNSNLPSDNHYCKPAIDMDGNIWTAGRDHLVKFDGNQFMFFDTIDIPHWYPNYLGIDLIAVSPENEVYVNTGITVHSISKYNGTSWENIEIDTNLLSYGAYGLSDMFFDQAGNLYLFSGGIILRYDGSVFTLVDNYPNHIIDVNGYSGDYIFNPLFDSNNDMWAVINNRLEKYDGTGFTIYTDSKAILESNQLLPQHIDSHGNHYISYIESRGFTLRTNYNFNTYFGDTYQAFVTMAPDTAENIWLGTASHDDPNMFNGDTIIEQALQNCGFSFVAGIAFDKNNVGYFCGEIGGNCPALQKLENGVYSNIWTGFDPVFYSALAVDTLNTLWIGTNSSLFDSTAGLLSYDGTSTTQYLTTNSGLPNNQIREIVVDSLNRIWVATHNGLAIFDRTNWTVFNTSNSPLPDNQIEWIHFNRGKVYIATQKGFGIYDGSTWQIYTPENSGLANEDCESIVVDYQCNVWVATECGLSQLVGHCNNTLQSVYGTLYTSSGQPMPNTLVLLMKQDVPGANLKAIDNVFTDENGQFAFATEESTVYLHALPNDALFPGQLPVYEDSVIVQQLSTPISVYSSVQYDMKCKPVINCLGDSHVSGSIIYPSGRNVSGKRIFLIKNNLPVATQITSIEGVFDFQNVVEGDYTIWVDQMSINNALSPVMASQSGFVTYSLKLNPTYLELINVNNTFSDTDVIIYPNPTSLNISIETQILNGTYCLTDITGKALLQGTANATKFNLDISALSSGVYFISVSDGERQVYGKVVKE